MGFQEVIIYASKVDCLPQAQAGLESEEVADLADDSERRRRPAHCASGWKM
jgi:hypothetical protein